MIKPGHLNKGDRVAIVSLSSGLLGEPQCAHQLKLGVRRMEEAGMVPVFMNNTLKGLQHLHDNPQARADDLKQAFFDDEIKAVFSAIGGDDTYRLLPYLLDDAGFVENVRTNPKIFMGFSDTTNNHLMFHRLGLVSYYGPSFLTDFAEHDQHMLAYTEHAINNLFRTDAIMDIQSSPTWYMDRTDYSVKALGTPRRQHVENKGHDIIYGNGIIEGPLLGGCLESLYDGYTGDRYPDQKVLYDAYRLMPTLGEWRNKIMFLETSEEKPSPESFQRYMDHFSVHGIFNVIAGLMVGKPIDEVHYDAYRLILERYAIRHDLPVIYNINFGHSCPRTILPYGLNTIVNFPAKTIRIGEPLFG